MIAAHIHTGRVVHVRHAAPAHRLAYRVWMLSVDLDRLDAIAAGSRLLRHNRAGLVAIRDADHGPRDGSALKPWVAARLAAAGMPEAAASVRFLLIPRVLGYGFNPIAFFFCHDAAGRLRAILHQVKNTFGDQHGYLMPVDPDAPRARHAAAKRMHVSPFFDMQGGYRFACSAPDFSRPDAGFAISIRYGAEDGPRLTATLALDGRPLDDAALARQLAAMPFVTFKVIAGIHWHALLVWMRGARFHRAPAPQTEPVSPGAPR
jgi:DUF1365 family protein